MYKWSIPLCFNFLHRNLFNVDMVWVDDILKTLGWIEGVDPIGTNRIVIFDDSIVCGFNISCCCCCRGNFFSSIIEVDKGIFVCGGGDGSFCNDACEEDADGNDDDDDDSSSSDWTIRDILWWVAVVWLPFLVETQFKLSKALAVTFDSMWTVFKFYFFVRSFFDSNCTTGVNEEQERKKKEHQPCVWLERC